jgi:hypothetical protein
MVAPAYSTDLTPILIEFPNTTGWTALGTGGAALTAPETDYYIQGNNCITKGAWASAIKGMIYNFGSGITVPTDGAVIMFLAHATMNSVAAQASGGIQLVIGSGSGDFDQWYVGGSDTEVFGLWNAYPVNPTITADNTTGSPTSTLQYFGGQANLPSGGPSKGSPWAIDAMRYGRCRIDATGGETADFARLADCEATANSNTNRWGLLALVKGVYLFQGFLSMGTVSTAVDWRDSDKQVSILNTDKVTAAFNRFEVLNASSNVEWTNYQITALGTTSPGTFVVTAGTVTLTDCQFSGLGTFTFLASSTATGCVFRGCDQITAPGTDLTDSVITGSTVSADTSAIVWDVNQDPDGELDNTEHVKGTAAHHAIELGTTSPLTMTFRGLTSSGYNASDAQNDSFFHVKRTGGTVTLNVTGGTGNFSYKTAGATVNVVTDQRTLTATAVDSADSSAIQNVRMLIYANTGGSMKADAAITSITRSGATATVTTTASHGLSTGDIVLIEDTVPSGALDAEAEYTGTHTATVTGASTFTYPVTGSPTTPATRTYEFSEVIVDNDLTDVNGEVSDTRTYASDQPIRGRAYKGTAVPTYKAQPISGTVSSGADTDITVTMISDD